jgi:flagellar FliL protein
MPSPDLPSPVGDERKHPMNKILLGAFMTVVIAIECVVAWLLIPSQAKIEEIAETKVAEKMHHGADPHDPASHGDHDSQHASEIDMGQFGVTAFQPASNTTLRIDFHLYGTVLASDAAEFEHVYASTQHRIREQVIVTIRNSEIGDLTDPGLGLIKRKILEKTNRLLGKAYLQNVVFSDFSFVEQ